MNLHLKDLRSGWPWAPTALWRCNRDWRDGFRTRWVATTDMDWLLEHGEILAVI